jgi:hypothetical protein
LPKDIKIDDPTQDLGKGEDILTDVEPPSSGVPMKDTGVAGNIQPTDGGGHGAITD